MKEFVKKILSNIELYEEFKSILTYHSSSIEGSKVSQEDNTRLVNNPTEKIISMELERYKKDEVIENKNLGDVFDDVIKHYNEPFSLNELKRWHQILKNKTDWSDLYPHAIGKFRTINIDVGDSENFAITWTTINEQMKNLIDDLNFERKFTLEDIAEFHCRFEKIHPFQDGNGRIGRMIILKQCMKHDIDLFFVNNDTRSEYINSLRMYHKTLSVLFLADYFKKQQQIFIVKYSKYLYELSKNETTIINYLSINKYISRSQVETLLKTKTSNAALILKRMVDKGFIKRVGNSSNTEYSLV